MNGSDPHRDAPPAESVQRAREAAAADDWGAAYELLAAAERAGALEAADLELLGEAARWTGRYDRVAAPLERAHEMYATAGDCEGAARTALELCTAHADWCKQALAASWWQRADELVAGVPDGPVRAKHAWFAARRHGERGDRAGQERDARRALELARRCGDRDVEALALIEVGHVATARGDTREALESLDRATGLALGGELGVFESGLVFCNAILASRSRGDWDRACEWTESATRWVERKRVAYFPGLCRVHRAEVLRVRGALDAAEYESEEAARALDGSIPRWASYAYAELGEVRRRRGDLAGAMAAFRRALELGWEPQPGLALLLLAQGDAAAAHRSLQRFLGAAAPTLACEDRAGLLAASVTVALAAGDVAAASAARDRLGELCGADALPWDRALWNQVRGEVALATGDAEEAARALLEARATWAELDAPYELATCRALLARALRAQGDHYGAELEGQIAATTYGGAGALLDERRVGDWLAGAAAAPPPAGVAVPEEAFLRCEGDTWAIGFGGRTVRLKAARGLDYLARLLAAPSTCHWAVDLAAGTGGAADGAARPSGDAAEILDDTARASYRRRLVELQAELDDARELHDEVRVASAREEMDTLTRALAAALGLGGRARRLGSQAERARQSVTKAIRGVLRRLAGEHPELGRYLQATVRTGTACRFEPDLRQPVRWVVEAGRTGG